MLRELQARKAAKKAEKEKAKQAGTTKKKKKKLKVPLRTLSQNQTSQICRLIR